MFLKIIGKNKENKQVEEQSFSLKPEINYQIRIDDKIIHSDKPLTFSEIINCLIENMEIYGVTAEICVFDLAFTNRKVIFTKDNKKVELLIGPEDEVPVMETVPYYTLLYEYLIKELDLPINWTKIKQV